MIAILYIKLFYIKIIVAMSFLQKSDKRTTYHLTMEEHYQQNYN